MATIIRTIDFLPEIFRTNTNDQFLSATLDQLIQPPDFRKVQGYIGSKFGYGVKSTDQYVQEPTLSKTRYQLEPSVVNLDPITGKPIDMITYPEIIDAITLESGITPNHNNLFSNQFYSWDSFVDLDKLINFGQYYWVPQTPESVEITTSNQLLNANIAVISNTDNTYSIDFNGTIYPVENPTLTLVRGGTYTFNVNQSTPFYIQTLPGVDGVDPTSTNISTRNIIGLDFNGVSNGTMTFTVPVAGTSGYNYLENIDVDLVSTLAFDQVNGQPLNLLNNIDGITTIDGKTIIFYGSKPGDIASVGDYFDSGSFDDPNAVYSGFGANQDEPLTGTIFKITLEGSGNDSIIKLVPYKVIPTDTTITIKYGNEYIKTTFVKNSKGVLSILPSDTTTLNTLYYQDGYNADKVGKIKIIDSVASSVLDVSDILYKTKYTSPNGIKFTNGLLIKFSGNVVPKKYLNNNYYVEGVGSSIQLIPVPEMITPEPFTSEVSEPFDGANDSFDQLSFGNTINLPLTPDYITINRSSIDRNAWSRSNRWFHVDVLNTIVANNLTSPIASSALKSGSARAKRPIIEFYPNLKLIYSGLNGKLPVDYIDNTTTNALSILAGADPTSYVPDGAISGNDTVNAEPVNSFLFDGCRIIFAAESPEARSKIYVVNIATINGQRQLTFNVAGDGHVNSGDQVIVTNGQTNKGFSFYFNGSDWVNSQTKTRVNQPPLFDVFDSNNISFSDGNYYPGTNFNGCTLFQYSPGTGTKDPILNFSIQYSGVGNLNDVNFVCTLNTDTFNFVNSGTSVTLPVGDGFVFKYADPNNYTRQIGWQTAVGKSFQYQIFRYEYTGASGVPITSFTIDIPMKDGATTPWPTSVVYINNNRISNTEYYVTVSNGSTVVNLTTSLSTNSLITIMIYSDEISSTGYYEVPSNLDQNPFNNAITTINAGDIRGHYKSICNNVYNFTGDPFGANNYRDLGNVVPYGTKIIQNSASLVTAAAFIRRQETNFFNSISYNSIEYTKFKALLLNTIASQDYTPYNNAPDMLDEALEIITSTKTTASPFFWSDMIPSKTPTYVNSYTFKIGISNTVYPLQRVYDFKNANYYSVLLYVQYTINGIIQYKQLTKDIDYFVNSDNPYVLLVTQLNDGDVVVVKEYTQTYGSYIPNTPTKVGFYSAYVPEIVLDKTYLRPTQFIRGHDGSLSKLYGEYDSLTNFFSDPRDSVLFEFENRVFNNLKITNREPVNYYDVFPGQFRTTGYKQSELFQLYNTGVLNWIGLNRIDISTQYYDQGNEYTWNYIGSKNKLTNTNFNQGNWRGIYLWLYDTATPHDTPWEMLGFTIEPSWWTDRYGPAPYTSNNTLLWNDLSYGFIYNDGQSYIDSRFARPRLLEILPVDSEGTLLSPFETVVGNYNTKTFNTNWVVGDIGPAEYSYRKSSSWPFDLMRIYALTKPSDFFTLGLDLDVYQYYSEFNQYLVYGRLRTPPNLKNTQFYGHDANNASHSYIDWIVDYLNQYGIKGTTIIETLFENLDVRLTYRVSGYSDQNKLNFIIEKGSPNSTNTSLMIPSENVNVILHQNEPNDSIVYSSVIVQKTSTGFKVFGNSQTKTYFTSYAPFANGKITPITVVDLTVNAPAQFSNQVNYTAYGTELSLTNLVNFLLGYGNYLETQGMIFDDIQNGTQLDWYQMCAELLYWVRTGWEVGSVINLNPCANQIHIETSNGIIQPFTYLQDNFILNQNLVPIKLSDMAIFRQSNKFTAKVLTNGDAISYFKADVSAIENAVVFDNQTLFNDVIYNLITGLRQQRLYLRGSKTNQWDGTLYAPGFILNIDNVQEWVPNTKYNKGTIVTYKRQYYMANQTVIAPTTTFNYNDWLLTNYGKIDKGMLPNPSSRASETNFYYDTYRSTIDTDGELLPFSLIGFRPRDYLAQADLNNISQVNFYQNMIEEKGTLTATNNLLNAIIQNNAMQYDIYENWMILNSSYGGVLNRNFVEFTLDESLLNGNPSILGLVNGNAIDEANQQVSLNNIVNYGRMLSDTNLLPVDTSSMVNSLPDAGYVNLDDVTLYSYTVERLNNASIYSVYANDYVWIADNQNAWKIFTPVSLSCHIISVVNNLNNTCVLTMTNPHGLSQYDVVGIAHYDSRIDGFYTVQQIVSNTSVLINLSLSNSTTNISFSNFGLFYKLTNMRVSDPTKINSLPLLSNEFTYTNVWVDKANTNDWALYQKVINYTDSNFDLFSLNNGALGSSVAYVPKLGYYVSDPVLGKVKKYIKSGKGYIQTDTITHGVGFGTQMARNDEFLIISEPSDSQSNLYIYRIVQLPEVEALVEEQIIPVVNKYVGSSMAFSGDGNYLFVGAPKINSVMYFNKQVDFAYIPFTSTFTLTTTLHVTHGSSYITINLNSASDTYFENEIGNAIGQVIYINNVSYSIAGQAGNQITLGTNYTGTTGTNVSAYIKVYENAPVSASTNPLDKFFKVRGNVIPTFTPGKRTAFVQYSQYGSSVLYGFGYDAQAGYNLNGSGDPNSAVYPPAPAAGDPAYNQKYRSYYFVITGKVDLSTVASVTISIDPTVDKANYIVNSSNSTYNSGTNTTKIYISQAEFNDIIYEELFSTLDNYHLYNLTIGNGSVAPIFTPAYILGVGNYVTVITAEYDSTTDTSTVHTVERIGYSITPNTISAINGSDTYAQAVNNQFNILGLIYINSSAELAQYYPNPDGTPSSVPKIQTQGSDNFGASIAVNYDATKIFIGSPTYHVQLSSDPDVPPVPNVGVVWVYDRLVETWQVQYTPQEFEIYAVVTPWMPTSNMILTINGQPISPTKYKTFLYTTIIGPRVKAGDVITISDTTLVLSDQLTSYQDINGVIPNQQFGTSISCNNTGSEVIISAPYDLGVQGQQGAVYRFTNEGKRFGFVTALIAGNNQLGATDIFINGYNVMIPTGDAFVMAEAINLAQINNVFAYETLDHRLVIRLINPDLGPANNKLNITVLNGNYFYEMGIAPYTITQVVREPHPQNNSKFGYNIKFNEQNSFVVTSPRANRFAETFFDYVDTNMHYNTVFDLNLTTFIDSFDNAGAAYMFDYISPYNEALLNIGQYIYAQPVNDNTSDYGSLPLYGSSLDFNNNTVMIGSPNFNTSVDPSINGKINIFFNSTGNQDWSVFRNSSPVVDVNKIQKIQLYNNLTDENLISLDYIDPLRGKMLGVVRENLDYIGTVDPAGYNNTNYKSTSIVWNSNQVGKIWFDTSSTKFLNYHQDDIAYNAKYWANLFPGSTVTVYTWVESSVTPAFYTGTGTPYDMLKYTTSYGVDSNNNLVSLYYFWVRGTNQLSKGKTLTDSIIEQYIANPQNSGIAYMAPLRPDAYALYNVRDYVNGLNTNIHIGFGTGTVDNEIHNNFKIIKSNYADDFLPGLPTATNTSPSGLYNRLLESFAGLDETGANVPNFRLPAYMQVGISVRPRQSMFINRYNALKNYIEFANNILSQYTVSEFSNLTYLNTSGDFFTTSDLWSSVYWWATGYGSTTKTNAEVGIFADLYRITPKEGMIVGVAKNGQGNREVYLYTSSQWTRIGLQNGTVKLSDKLWDYQTNKIGFGDNFYDTVPYDAFPSVETYYIIRSLNEQIFVGPLQIYRNQGLILMFEYIQSESAENNGYLPWLNKTSFADVSYVVRELKQEVNYYTDNDTLLSGYINEVKPYHTVIKDFSYEYTSIDAYPSTSTDFDLPPLYNNVTGKFDSPKLQFINPNVNNNEYGLTNLIWETPSYNDWIGNFGLSLQPLPNFNIGLLSKYVALTDVTLYIDNARGIPSEGVLNIDNETISYTSVNRDTGLIGGLSRGLNGTAISVHLPGAVITVDLPAVVVLDSGRGYIDPPSVTAYIDTTIYPAPTREAVLAPVMAGDKVIGIDVIDPGENYAAQPTIVFSGSYSVDFPESDINFLTNTIVVPTLKLETGDLIYSTCTNGVSAIPNGYYYVFVVAKLTNGEDISISLHSTYSHSLQGQEKLKFVTIDPTATYNFIVTARAIAITSNINVRGLNTTMRFDRTSYESKVNVWKPNQFWGTKFIDMKVDPATNTYIADMSSSNELLDATVAYTNKSGTVSPTGGSGAIFTINNILLGGTYDASITNSGSGYSVNDVITILGTNLAGSTPTNDCAITVTSVTNTYIQKNQDTTSGSGTGALFNIESIVTSTAANYTAQLTAITGLNYAVNDTITFSGIRFGGTTPTNDVTIIVNSVSTTGQILSISMASGTNVANGHTYNVPISTGEIKTFTMSGVALDNNLASLQGAVMPVVVTTPGSSSQNVNVELNFGPSTLQPGQIQGALTYFYTIHSPDYYTYDDTGAGGKGAIIHIYAPKFNPYNVTSNYYMKIINGGTGYQNGDQIKISGTLLFGGTTPANDALITISQVNVIATTYGSISVASITGIAISNFGSYYVKPVNWDSTTKYGKVSVYKDTNMQLPVIWSEFNFNTANSFAYIPEPLVMGPSYKYEYNSIVVYEGNVYSCIASNNDSTFNSANWQLLESSDRALNALDRIIAYYQPTVNMPARDLVQLVQGISYPGTVYYGNSFSPEDIIPEDIILTGQQFYPRDLIIKAMIYDGTKYLAVGENDANSLLISSTDGLNWELHTVAEHTLNITDIIFNNNQYFISTLSLNDPILISYNGTTWLGQGQTTLFDTIGFSEEEFDSSPVDYPQDQVNQVIVGNDNYYYGVGRYITRSTDGVIWNRVFNFNTSTLNTIYSIAPIQIQNYNGFIAVGGGNYIVSGIGTSAPQVSRTSIIITSLDGVNWTLERPNISLNTFYVVLSNSDIIVIAGENSEVWYSINGANWTMGIIAGATITNTFRSGVYANGKFVLVGDNGTIVSSTDGIHWTQRTNTSLTINNLNNVMFANMHYYASGDNATIIRSSDSISWSNASSLTPAAPDSVVSGQDFLYGYGPEELVAGYMTDSISLTVTTAPGSSWDDQNILEVSDSGSIPIIGYTGFKMKQVIGTLDSTNTISFDHIVKVPSTLSVFIVDNSTGLSKRIYSISTISNPISYTVNWINKTVTLSAPLSAGHSVMIEIYAVGNGKQVARNCSDNFPITINPITGFSEIKLTNQYISIITDPVIYHNGVKLTYLTDYTITYGLASYTYMKIEFNTTYNQATDFISWAILDTSVSDFQATEVMYSAPATQIVTGSTSTTIISTNYFGKDNTANAIVEKNGLRLQLTTDYTFDSTTGVLTLASAPLSTDIIAITTYNETDRLYLQTNEFTYTSGAKIFAIPNPTSLSTTPIYYHDNTRTWVTVNGYRLLASNVSLDNSNNLTINTTLNSGDVVIITNTIDGGTPNEMTFKIDIDKFNNPIVYRTNSDDGTWLTQTFNFGDDIAYLHNITNIVDLQTITTSVSGSLTATVANNVDIIKHVVVYNQTTSLTVPSADYTITRINGVTTLSFTIGVSSGDNLSITLYLGGIIDINGEKIRYLRADPVANTISGLTRGILGSGTIQVHQQYAIAYGLTSSRTLDPVYYNQIWNNSGSPLQISNTNVAKFLQYGQN